MTGVHGGRPVLDDGRVLEVDSVVWCTGFARDYRWIRLPVFGPGGDPVHHRGVDQGRAGPCSAPAYDRDVLAGLLGSTRAALLVAAAGGETTSGLAQEVGVSVAAASQQLAALRNAGLVASTRRGRAVCHDLTPLGVQVLLASRPLSQS